MPPPSTPVRTVAFDLGQRPPKRHDHGRWAMISSRCIRCLRLFSFNPLFLPRGWKGGRYKYEDLLHFCLVQQTSASLFVGRKTFLTRHEARTQGRIIS
ncbi:hypothetical protein LX36DRAFT_68351 [Colletotrichum falcatum]|nr:hypothetical protein LX36DRAFT_68351 [Colletotrichum falcatum]